MSYYNRGLYGGWVPTMDAREFTSGRGDITPKRLIEAYMASRYAPDKEYRKAARMWMSAKRRANRKAYERAGRQRDAYLYRETNVQKPKMTRAGRDAIWHAWSTAAPNAAINAYISHGNWGQARLNPYAAGGGRGVWNRFVQEMFRSDAFRRWYTENLREKPLADIASYWRSLRRKPSDAAGVTQAVRAWRSPGGALGVPATAASAAMSDLPTPPAAFSVRDVPTLQAMLQADSSPPLQPIIDAIVATAGQLQGQNLKNREELLDRMATAYGEDAAAWANAIN